VFDGKENGLGRQFSVTLGNLNFVARREEVGRVVRFYKQPIEVRRIDSEGLSTD